MDKQLQWENLEERRKTTILCILFKIQHGLIDIDRQHYIFPNDSRTRGIGQFIKKEQKLTPMYSHSSRRQSWNVIHQLPYYID